VSQEILKKHQTTLHVKSRKIRHRGGTTFSMWLPITSSLEQER
jgi:signal transduction histidine kinase